MDVCNNINNHAHRYINLKRGITTMTSIRVKKVRRLTVQMHPLSCGSPWQSHLPIRCTLSCPPAPPLPPPPLPKRQHVVLLSAQAPINRPCPFVCMLVAEKPNVGEGKLCTNVNQLCALLPP
ncbi:hypothetical protein DUNSADRAFT_3123 [Dunaliella salina]|uniref:Encoded protein n=1 Tax=Dunaliella salina TaxID=3046 RepID=A0ABQ7H814_DUNSA|nr:hypothetical protein DUNSADRAFT_3123 [Dunaliella salina]|eukprot:KAF5842994.1 hypothetical protein DUNSADRAFT_3123 [Dunaliella salina]